MDFKREIAIRDKKLDELKATNQEFLEALKAVRRHGLIEKDGYETVVGMVGKAIEKQLNDSNQMNPENLISLSDFAKQSGLKPSEVTRLITPQRIKPEVIGSRKFIDKTKYPPADFKKPE